MDVDAYLRRIGLTGPIRADLPTLERLQRAHLTSIPFENLDVFARREVRTEDDWTVDRLVTAQRGGWCFTLNGAFAALLTEIGYEVKRVAATVLYANTSPMPTHLALEVALDRPYLVDVGFGDSFIRPLPLDSPGPHDGGTGEFGFVFDEGGTTLVSWDDGATGHYRFDPTPRSPADFEGASTYLRTTPGLQWTASPFATRLLDGGPDRVTLLSDRIKFRRGGVWEEHPVEPAEWDRLLAEWFELAP